MTFDNGHHITGVSANPGKKLGMAKRLAFCAVLIAAAMLAEVATEAWGVREQGLFAVIGVLAVFVSLFWRRRRLAD